MKDEKALIVIDGLGAEVFTADGMKKIVDQIKAKVDEFVPDATTRAGREEIASMAWKVARSKTLIDDLGKGLVAGWKKQAGAVDAQRKAMRDTLDQIKEDVRRPLTEWEQAEERRRFAIEEKIKGISAAMVRVTRDWMFIQLTELQTLKIWAEGLTITEDVYQEYTFEAELAKDKLVTAATESYAARVKYDNEQAELARLREEEKARKKEEARKKAEEAEAARKKEEEEKAAKAATPVSPRNIGSPADIAFGIVAPHGVPGPPAPIDEPLFIVQYGPSAGQKRTAAAILREKVGYIDLRLAEEIIEMIVRDEIPFVKFVG